VLKKITRGSHGNLEDMLQPGRRQVAAGYVIYGSSTMMVYSTGAGVHGFTLDPSIGEFLLSHPNIHIPERGRYLSVNNGYEQSWDAKVTALMRRYRGLDGVQKPMNERYVGSLVADYPANNQSPRGKLRLLYEANPLAFIVEAAGGAATDGNKDILNVMPDELHQRTPLFIGSKEDVQTARELLKDEGRREERRKNPQV
jgi:fructose-1,6-bisphosphatase I